MTRIASALESTRHLAAIAVLIVATGCSQNGSLTGTGTTPSPPQQEVPETIAMGGERSVMSFFITSRGTGNGGDLGGLTGADAHCQALAEAEYAAD